jgi:hypothetical protein
MNRLSGDSGRSQLSLNAGIAKLLQKPIEACRDDELTKIGISFS